MSDWSDDYSNTDLTSGSAATSDLDWSAIWNVVQGDLTPQEQQAAASLGGDSASTAWTGGGLKVGNVAGGTNTMAQPDKGGSIWDKIAGWAQSDKGMTSIATALMGGVGMLSQGKRKDRGLSIMERNAASNEAAVAERKRQFDIQMANASSIGQTNFGAAMAPGMINAPVRLTRNRLIPTPGVPA